MPQDFAPVLPAPLRPGARIAVIAPSSPFDRTLVFRGLGWLAGRYRLEWDRSLFARQGYLAGSDERRLAELDRCFRDPNLAAVITARGGYGLSRIAERADWAALARHPKWLVGFSDTTLLHLFALRSGVASLHGHNVAGLGRGDARGRARFSAVLEAPGEVRTISGLPRNRHQEQSLVPGECRLSWRGASVGTAGGRIRRRTRRVLVDR